MAEYNEKYNRTIYTIPTNYMEAGTFSVFGYPVKKRNAVEAVIVMLFMFFLSTFFHFENFISSLPFRIFFCGLPGLIAVVGIKGDPLSVCVMDYYRWYKGREVMIYNHHPEAYIAEAARMLREEETFRDKLYAIKQSLAEKTAPKAITYVEGENFVFAEDPQREALRYASEQYLEQLAEESEEDEEEAPEEKSVFDAPEEPGLDLGDLISGNFDMNPVEFITEPQGEEDKHG